MIICAGFDTRAFRLPGGCWVELDEPALLAPKEAELPARSAPNPRTRVAIESAFSRYSGTIGKLLQDLGAPYGRLEGR